MLRKREYAVMVGGAIVVAVMMFLGLLAYQHASTDHDQFHQLIQLVNYNIQTGHLVVPQAPPPPVAAAPLPPAKSDAPKPSEPAKKP